MQKQQKELNKKNPNVFKIFSGYLSQIEEQESYYILEKMIEFNLIDESIIKKVYSKYFAHRKTEAENRTKYYNDSYYRKFILNYEKLSKNDWELHKKLIKEEVNPLEVAKIIQNDDVDKLQEISTQPNFNINQFIEPSLYQKYSYINQKHVTLIDYAAFFSSVKCFKFLLMNNANVNNTGKYAIASGNHEIIHLCEQNHSTFKESYEAAIKFHQNDIFHYIFEKKLEKKFRKLLQVCSDSGNYEIFFISRKNGVKASENIIHRESRIGNLYLVENLLKTYPIPSDILILSSESGNIELVKYILDLNVIDINTEYVYFDFLIFENNIWNMFI